MHIFLMAPTRSVQPYINKHATRSIIILKLLMERYHQQKDHVFSKTSTYLAGGKVFKLGCMFPLKIFEMWNTPLEARVQLNDATVFCFKIYCIIPTCTYYNLKVDKISRISSCVFVEIETENFFRIHKMEVFFIILIVFGWLCEGTK